MSLASGTRFGSYEVSYRIGVGGMGEVHVVYGLERAGHQTALVKESVGGE